FSTAEIPFAVGDPLLIGGFSTAITAVGNNLLYFEPVTQPLVMGEPVTVEVRAGDAWTVEGSTSGLVGRATTGQAFNTVIAFQIVDQGAAPTTGDQFIFDGQGNVSPIFLSGAPSDL